MAPSPSDAADVDLAPDDELLYRRVPAHPQFVDPGMGTLLADAVSPDANDADGLSLSREVVGVSGTAATGSAGKAFFVATFRAGDLRRLGLTVVADRADHVYLPELTYAVRRSTDVAVRRAFVDIRNKLLLDVRELSGAHPGGATPRARPDALSVRRADLSGRCKCVPLTPSTKMAGRQTTGGGRTGAGHSCGRISDG